jgi:hypothetical protein
MAPKAVADPSLFFSHGTLDYIASADVDGSNAQVVAGPGSGSSGPNASGVATDGVHLYWADNFDRTIKRSDLDGGNATTIVDVAAELPTPVSFNFWTLAHQGDSLFWTNPNANRIGGAKTDGSDANVLVDLVSEFGAGSYLPRAVTANTSAIYWTDSDQDGVYTADRDGSNPQKIIDFDTLLGDSDYIPSGITTVGNEIYWGMTGLNKIYRANLDGTDAVELLDLPTTFGAGNYNPLGLTNDGQGLWLGDDSRDSIFRFGTDGSNPTLVLQDTAVFVPSTGAIIRDVDFLAVVPVPEPSSLFLAASVILVYCSVKRRV